MISNDGYCILDPDAIETPAMVVFEQQVDANIRELCKLAGAENLAPHVKTTKSIDVIRKQVAAGILTFKTATLSELETAIAAGCATAILAYPIIQRRKAERFARVSAANPNVEVCAVVAQPEHIDVLRAAAADAGTRLRVMLDLDVGMHRTGCEANERAAELYGMIDADPDLIAAGLHAYDGHDHASDLDERQAQANEHVAEVTALRDRLEADGLSVPLVVGGGSFSFPYYARQEGMLGSPGTVIYWDAGYEESMPDMPFRPASMVLTQVIDRHADQGTVTLDLGSKAISSDMSPENRVRFLGRKNFETVMQNEEHCVFRFADNTPKLGDYLLAIPVHVCPTTIRYPGCHVIDKEGNVSGYWTHTARDR